MTRRPWLPCLKWGSVATLLFCAGSLYFYSYPRWEEFQVKFPTGLSGLASIWMPSELEKDETGKTTLSVHNTGHTKVLMNVQLQSEDIEYRRQGSDRVALGEIDSNETRAAELTFLVRSPKSGHFFS